MTAALVTASMFYIGATTVVLRVIHRPARRRLSRRQLRIIAQYRAN